MSTLAPSVEYLDRWPAAPPCPLCKSEIGVSHYDEKMNETVFTHADGAQACRAEGGSPYRLLPDGSLAFPVRGLPEFLDVADGLPWAWLVAQSEGGPVYLGYIRASDGHRKIGRVEHARNALATANPGDPEPPRRTR